MPLILTVRELVAYIRQLLEYDEVLADLWVEGEVSNFSRSSAGHLYFTLKDDNAQLSCACFRGAASRLERLPNAGEMIAAHGQVSFYEAGGKLQLYVDTLRPLGVGALWQRFQELKARLEEQGLFAEEAKRPLPAFPHCIGVVTSPTGAAVRDILHILARRYPLARVIVAPTAVQGKEAAGQIVAALERLSHFPVDVILVARGGGSIEDLWPFNEEVVARAIRAAPVPVISGVGHETDFTIADFAADVRAPTPTAAAALAVPDQAELSQQLSMLEQRLGQGLRLQVGARRRDLQDLQGQLRRLSPQRQLAGRRQSIDDLSARMARCLRHRLAITGEQLRGTEAHLAALNPLATLQRGYAVVRRKADQQVILSPSQVSAGDRLEVQVRDGTFEAEGV